MSEEPNRRYLKEKGCLSIRIEKYFNDFSNAGMIELHVTPRQIWEEALYVFTTDPYYNKLLLLHDGDISFMYYKGAKLIRREPEANNSG